MDSWVLEGADIPLVQNENREPERGEEDVFGAAVAR